MNLIINIIIAGALMSYLGTGVATEQRHVEDSHNHDSTVASTHEQEDEHEEL